MTGRPVMSLWRRTGRHVGVMSCRRPTEAPPRGQWLHSPSGLCVMSCYHYRGRHLPRWSPAPHACHRCHLCVETLRRHRSAVHLLFNRGHHQCSVSVRHQPLGLAVHLEWCIVGRQDLCTMVRLDRCIVGRLVRCAMVRQDQCTVGRPHHCIVGHPHHCIVGHQFRHDTAHPWRFTMDCPFYHPSWRGNHPEQGLPHCQDLWHCQAHYTHYLHNHCRDRCTRCCHLMLHSSVHSRGRPKARRHWSAVRRHGHLNCWTFTANKSNPRHPHPSCRACLSCDPTPLPSLHLYDLILQHRRDLGHGRARGHRCVTLTVLRAT